MLKRKLSYETNINTKRKKRNIINSMLDDISYENCTKKFDNESLKKFQGNI